MTDTATQAKTLPAPAMARGWLARVRAGRLLESPPPLEPVEIPARRLSGYLVSFLVTVALPALAAAFYFLALAANQYVAETRFAVHSLGIEMVTSSASASKPSTASSLMGGLKAASDDAYLVAAYIRSRACVEEVARALPLSEIFRRPEADVWARLKSGASPEELTDYWGEQVRAYVDPPSGIVTVTVAAFRRDDALALSRAILAAADKEAAEAQERVIQSLTDLRAFRERAGFIDPKAQAETLGRVLEGLIAQRLRLETEYQVGVRAMSPTAPTLQSLKSRIAQLDLEIAGEKAKLTSGSRDNNALADALPQYEALTVRNQFAEKLYGFAADGLERARLRAAAQAIYLDVFVPPALPQDALYPERISSPILIALALAILWGIAALTAALVEDHKI